MVGRVPAQRRAGKYASGNSAHGGASGPERSNFCLLAPALLFTHAVPGWLVAAAAAAGTGSAWTHAVPTWLGAAAAAAVPGSALTRAGPAGLVAAAAAAVPGSALTHVRLLSVVVFVCSFSEAATATSSPAVLVRFRLLSVVASSEAGRWRQHGRPFMITPVQAHCWGPGRRSTASFSRWRPLTSVVPSWRPLTRSVSFSVEMGTPMLLLQSAGSW